MNDDSSPLCCCEYYDVHLERNHILACCCNCQDLDEAFDRLIRGSSISERTKRGLFLTMHDRLRIPWKGGAKQIAFDAVLPIFIIPIMLLVASISMWWTIFSFTTVAIFLSFVFSFLIRTLPQTKFFFMWTLSSLVVLYIIFELVVIPFLEILLEENIALSILICGFVVSGYILKKRTKELISIETDAFGARGVQSCVICQIKIPEKDHHCVWFDCCIGKHNQGVFVLCLLFGILALLYSSNLTLTSVCHPFIFYKYILLPDDCSDVYQLFELAISFVSALYSLILAALMLTLFLHQLLLISLGLTTKEWSKLPLSSKLCLGLCANRPHTRGFYRNWMEILCWRRNSSGRYNQV